MCYFFQKIKNLLQFTFEKITCCAKREKKITCREEKSQPPWISNGPSLKNTKLYLLDKHFHMGSHANARAWESVRSA